MVPVSHLYSMPSAHGKPARVELMDLALMRLIIVGPVHLKYHGQTK